MARSRAVVLLLAWLSNVLIATRSATGARDEQDFEEPELQAPAPIVPDLEAECKDWVVVAPTAPNGTLLSNCNEETPCSLQSVLATMNEHQQEDDETCIKARPGEYIVGTELALPRRMRLFARNAVMRCHLAGGFPSVERSKSHIHIDGLQMIGCSLVRVEGPALFGKVTQVLVTLKDVTTLNATEAVTIGGAANTFVFARCKFQRLDVRGIMFGTIRMQGMLNQVFLHGTEVVDNIGCSGISASGLTNMRHNKNHLHVLDGSLIANNGAKGGGLFTWKVHYGLHIFGHGTAVTVRDSTIRGSGGHGIFVAASAVDLTLQNVSVEENGYHGIIFAKAHSGKCSIKDSSVAGHPGVGIYITEDSKNITLDIQTSRVEDNVGSGVKVSQSAGQLKMSMRKTTLRSNGIAGLHVDGVGSAQQFFNLTDMAIVEHRSCGIISKSVHSQWHLARVEVTRNAGGGVRLRADPEIPEPVLEVEVDDLNATANSGHALELRGCLECARNQATARNLMLRNNVDGISISMKQAEFDDVKIIGSWRAVLKVGETGSVHLQNIHVARCGVGVEVEGHGNLEVGNLTLLRNEKGVRVTSNSNIRVRDVMARQNHIAFEAEKGAALGLDRALLTDNVKGVHFVRSADINISKDSFVYLNEMHDIQCDITTTNSGPWLEKASSWIRGSWQSCSPGLYSWTTWVLAVPHNRIKFYVRGLAICCCLALNLPLILADKAAKDAKVQKSMMKKERSSRRGHGAEGPEGATESMSFTLASAASMLRRPSYKEALRKYVRTLKAFYVLAGLLAFMLAGCMLWLLAALSASWDTYGELMVHESSEFVFMEGRASFLRRLVKEIGVIFLFGGSLWLTLQSLRQQRITLQDAWSALKRDSVDTKERLRQQLLSHSQ